MNSENIETLEEPPKKKNRNLITIKLNKSIMQAFLIPGAFLFGLWVGYLNWGKDVQTAQVVENSKLANGSIVNSIIPIQDNDPTIGAFDAPITIIEFSDFECPYCQRHNQEVLGKIIENYGDQVQYIFKDFPLFNIHPNAVSAAVSAHCAGEQGYFWQYHDLLFSGGLGFSSNALIKYAETISLEKEQFAVCIVSDKVMKKVQDNYELGQSLGVTSTPSFFINGKALIGAQPYEVFAQVIESELALINK